MIAYLTVLDLEVLAPNHDAFAAALSPDEHARVTRLTSPSAKARLVLRRGALRHLLATHRGVDPADLRFETGPHGKPTLAAAAGLRFNASSSGPLAALVVAPDGAVGVDVEWRRPFPGWGAIASRFLGRAERAYLEGLPEADRESAFLRLWTAVEAVTKLHGEALSIRAAARSRRVAVRTVRVGDHAWASLAGFEAVTAAPDRRLPGLLVPAAVPWTAVPDRPIDR